VSEKLDLDLLCTSIELLKAQRDKAEEAIAHAQEQIMNQLREQSTTSATTKAGRKVTIVEPVRTGWNPDVLASILSPDLWEEVTKRVIDQDRLEAVVDREKIPTATLAEALVETKTKAYVKITQPKKKRQAVGDLTEPGQDPGALNA
jgi:hypothetical protein